MNYPTYGRSKRLTVTGLTCISSVTVAHVIGVLFSNTATGSLAIYHGVTASSTAAYVRGYQTTAATGQISLYYPCPAYCSGGITVGVGESADNNITLFWNPAT